MANKKLSRKELLKGTDEFMSLSSRAVVFFNAHLRELKIVGIALAVIIVGYLAIYAYLGHINKKGQEAYNLAYNTLTAEEGPQPMGQIPAPSPEERNKAEAQFETVVEEYGMSKAARVALPQIAHIKFTQNQYDEAIRYYDRFANDISGKSQYEDLTALGLATCYEAKGEAKKAISILLPLVENPANPFRETAMLSLERLYRIDNQPEKANEILKKFIEEYQNSPFLPMAKARL